MRLIFATFDGSYMSWRRALLVFLPERSLREGVNLDLKFSQVMLENYTQPENLTQGARI